MVIKPGFDLEELVKVDAVHKRVFRDPEIFELEMENIYYRTWVYVGHESEIPMPGDYKTSYIGQQPVIVARGSDDGEIRVLHNSCRHRGTTVCVQVAGNANFFRCPYHGWTYNNQGDLVGVPHKEAYGDSFSLAERGLARAPRVESYSGFIFASLSAEGPSLHEHLGRARRYMDFFADQGPQGIMVRPDVVHKTGYDGNWKYQVENVVDGYHFEFVHNSLRATKARGGQRQFTGGNPPAWSLDLGNGHSVNRWEESMVSRREKPGREVYNGVGGFKMTVFPNLVLIAEQVRHIVPKAAGRSELWVHPVLLKGVPDSINGERLRKHEDFYGPAGLGSPDDWEIYDRVQVGAESRGNDWLFYGRSLDSETVNERGELAAPDNELGETPLRALYKQWKVMIAGD